MNDIKLPRLPNVQVPRIDADVSLIDIRVLAKWCQRVATDYARAAVEADRVDHAQQDAPTDADLQQAWYDAVGGTFVPEDVLAFGRMVASRYAPVQDAERERNATLHPNHIPDLRYILAVLERLSKSRPKDGELSAAVTGMRYVVRRTEDAARAQRAAAQEKEQ